MKLAHIFKQIDKNTNIGLKTNNKLNNIIGNSIENHNRFEKKRSIQTKCNNYNKFYIGRTKINFKIRFNEHRRHFAVSTRKSTFSEHILNVGHEMQPLEETMTILHFENDPRRINTLEELEIVKATTSDCMLNIVQNINPLYYIPQSVQDRTTANADDS